MEEKIENFMKDLNNILYYNHDDFHRWEMEELAEERAQKLAEERAQKLAEERAQKIAEEMAKEIAEEMAEKIAEEMTEEKVKEKMEENAIETAKKFLKMGVLTDKQIIEGTGISKKELDELKNNKN